jgi:hypothetical protein
VLMEKFAFYLDDLMARALLVEKGSASPAIAAGLKLGIEFMELAVPDTAPAGYLIVAQIPKGATGKLQCIGLAQKLGLAQ